jgi:hypothetical protein
LKQVIKLSAKEREAREGWERITNAHSGVTRYAGKYGGPTKTPRKFKPVTLSPQQVGGRVTTNPNVNIRSVPMGAGGTVPYDPSLEEAKANLAWRAGQLYNKGGDQYMTDEDLKQMQTGALRRRN